MKTANSNIAKLLGNRIREFRQLKKITQEELAHQANISTQHLGTIERGEQNPTLSTITAVADALGVPPYLLLCDNLLTFETTPSAAQQETFYEEFIQLPAEIQEAIRAGVHRLHLYYH